jgi:L-threonylcarbamoyladenylate synthase
MAPARIVDASSKEAIQEAARIIRRGGLVAFPTETVYGLGADAGNPSAVARIFEVKERPLNDPIIIHVANAESAGLYGVFPEKAYELTKRYWPGPLTLVVPKSVSVPLIVTAGLETAAIRVPAHPAALSLIQASNCPIAAPSANPFGYISPTEACHVAEQLGDKIDLILDGGPCIVGVESTILSLADTPPRILRLGGVTIEELESILGKLDLSTGSALHPQAPGQLKRHYATRTPLEIAEENEEEIRPGTATGLLSFQEPGQSNKFAAVEILSPAGNLREAAANLFAALRRLDSLKLDRIIARPLQEEGLGAAIMDRLRRCSARD